MSNLGLERFLAEKNIGLHRTRVGDRYVVERMREGGLNVGGEQSGHMILSDFATTGDGLVAALQVLATIRAEQRPASEVCRRFTPLPQLLRNVRFAGGAPLSHPDVLAAMAKAEAELGDTGRILLRPSGTEPLIRVMAEAADDATVARVVDDLCKAIVAASPVTAAAAD